MNPKRTMRSVTPCRESEVHTTIRFDRAWPMAVDCYFANDMCVTAEGMRICRKRGNSILQCLGLDPKSEESHCIICYCIVLVQRVYLGRMQQPLPRYLFGLILIVAAQILIDDIIVINGSHADLLGLDNPADVDRCYTELLKELDYNVLVSLKQFTEFKIGVQCLIHPLSKEYWKHLKRTHRELTVV